ncbi:MAG: ftsA [Bacilli bacterium]|nr:ftsA [Bacilli bacterium]
MRAIIAEITDGSLNIVGVGSADGEGIRKGAIVDIDKTVHSIREAVEHAERMVGIQIDSAYVGISGNHILMQQSQGVVAVSSPDREIGQEDIDRVLQAARVVALPPEREIIAVVPREFRVDGLDEIQDPRGMIGVRLEVDAYIITGAKTVVHNLLRCVERAGMVVAGLVLNSLGSATVALSADEQNLGVVLVDIGAGQTTISIFEKGVLVSTASLSIGGDYITQDIAIGMKTTTEVADAVKIRYGTAMVAAASAEDSFKIPRIGSQGEKEISQQELASIIEPRMQEIFYLINKEIDRIAPGREFPGGFVLCGGVAALAGTDRLAEHELGAPVRIAVPEFLGVRDPSYVNGVGVIRYVMRTYGRRAANLSSVRKQKVSNGLFDRIKGWFSDFV